METCPTTEELLSFLHAAEPGQECVPLQKHVAECGSCQALLDELTDIPVAPPAPLETTLPQSWADILGRVIALPPWNDLVTPIPDIPGYEILAELGRGGMGVVYKARHLLLKRDVALKMILAGGHAGEQERIRFRIEVEAVARLQHPNIVQIHEVGETAGLPYCALELVEGGSLAKKLAGQPLPAREGAGLLELLARAMQVAHSRNIIHRDLKPGNVLLTPGGQPKIADFGLSRRLDAVSFHTHSGAILGTPSYMAPEQAAGWAAEAGPAADVYALGAILYECLTGRPPFKAATPAATLAQVQSKEPVPPRKLHSKVPADLDTICLKCLHKLPERRYTGAAALADDLRRFLDGRPILARPAGYPERVVKWVRRHPTLTTSVLLAQLALALFVGVLVARSYSGELEETNKGLDKALHKAEEKRRDADLRRKQAEEQLPRALQMDKQPNTKRAVDEFADMIKSVEEWKKRNLPGGLTPPKKSQAVGNASAP